MGLLRVLITSVTAFAELFLITKIIGDRQISQLSMFDYINGITIGSIAAEMALAETESFTTCAVAMLIFGVLTLIFAKLTDKSITLRKIISGLPIVLYADGKLYRENFKRISLDLNEFLTLCRNSGYFNLASLHTVLMEPNGKLSFLPKSDSRETQPADFNMTPPQEEILINVIMDGKIMHENLKHTGNNLTWLENELKKQNIKTDEIFLATCDCSNNLSVYKKKR